MLLERLREYQSRSSKVVDRNTDLPPGYKLTSMPWIIQLNENGEQPHFIRTSGGRYRRDTGVQLPAPLLRRSGTKIKPQLLADTAEFVLGVPNPNDPQRANGRHQEFVALVEACATHIDDERVRAIAKFLRRLPVSGLPDLPPDLQPQGNVTFQVGDIRPIDLETVRGFWARIVPSLGQKGLPVLTRELILSWLESDTEDDNIGQCLVCGEMKSVVRVHPVPIRLPRAVSDQQLSIVTANKDAFWSYGLEQSSLAPTCRECAEAYARGINHLAQEEKSHILIGSSIFLFWTRENVGFNFFTLITGPEPGQVKSLIDSARSGRRQPEIDDTAFYATALSGSGGRAVVRDWLDTTVGEVKRHLATWFQWQSIVGERGEPEAFPLPIQGYWHEARQRWVDGLADSLVPELRGRRDVQRLPPTVAKELLFSTLTGAPLPYALLYQAVRRNRAEQRVTYPRAALIKLVLLSQRQDYKEDYMVQLDPDHPSLAYHCGRLLTVLETIQRLAIPRINATIVDRFYGTASASPVSVFPRLVRGAQPHLGKLLRDNRGAHYALQQRLEEILDRLPNYPRVLTLEEQGLFSLGFYHQRAHDRAQAREAADRRRQGLPVEPAAALPLDAAENLNESTEQEEE